MASLNQVFTTDNLPKSESNFDPLPAGWYVVKVTKSDLTPTKSGTGSYLNMRYDVLGPTHQGRVVFGMITIENQNAKAEEIGRQNLGDLMRAIGLARLEDTDQLISGMLQIKLGIKEDDYGIKNDVKGYKAVDGGTKFVPPSSTPQNQSSTQQSSPPWAKKN